MIWSILIVSLGLASARDVTSVSPEYLDALREAGQDEEFARLLGVETKLVTLDEQRSEGSMFNFVSPLGDILLSEEQERQGLNFNKYPGNKWPNRRIPYAITNSDFTDEQRRSIVDSINDFNRRVRNLQIVPRNGERDYVQVINGNGCWSYLGRIRNQQALSLQSNGCLSRGTVQHEFMHAAGFAHEHNRADRDNHVKVLWGNITERWRSQYQKVNNDDYPAIHNYDYDSVMHYPIWSPDQWWLDAFELPRGIDRNRLGQSRGVSNIDVQKLNTLYS